MAAAVSSTAELLALLELDPADVAAVDGRETGFALRVPRSYVRRMRRGDPRDPLLLQVLPLRDELSSAPGFSADPLAERDASPTPGLLHKYHGRVLLVTTGACAVNCRYCFRRHFPYGEHQPWGDGWGAALDYIAADPSVREVILSGGDPLALGDDRLAELARGVAEIQHVTRLRVHSRLPIVLPERVDEALLDWLGGSSNENGRRLDKVLVVHANHPREIDQEVVAALRRLHDAGVTLLNQAVLLRGVNDHADTLAELSERLFAAGVLPYYLHVLDRVDGAAHFLVDDDAARRLVGALHARLPGYLVPRLVREDAGAASKVPILPILPSGG